VKNNKDTAVFMAQNQTRPYCFGSSCISAEVAQVYFKLFT